MLYHCKLLVSLFTFYSFGVFSKSKRHTVLITNILMELIVHVAIVRTNNTL